tara:strand:+ start:119 stop:337 length:219 start_codon:yes stop_codon:yes gene_type:complete
MKNFNGFIIIAISIIIGAIIIAIPIYNKSISSLDHCYEKVYSYELKNNLKYYSKEEAEAEAAKYARRKCIRR